MSDMVNEHWRLEGDGGPVVTFYGMEEHLSELDNIKEGIGMASKAITLDTGTVMIFNSITKEWVEFGGN